MRRCFDAREVLAPCPTAARAVTATLCRSPPHFCRSPPHFFSLSDTAFPPREVKKDYLALLEGRVERELEIDAPICRYEGRATLPPRGAPGTHRGAADFRMAVGDGAAGVAAANRGKPARTALRPLGWGTYAGRPVSLCALTPSTGRRHQLRLHAVRSPRPPTPPPEITSTRRNQDREKPVES